MASQTPPATPPRRSDSLPLTRLSPRSHSIRTLTPRQHHSPTINDALHISLPYPTYTADGPIARSDEKSSHLDEDVFYTSPPPFSKHAELDQFPELPVLVVDSGSDTKSTEGDEEDGEKRKSARPQKIKFRILYTFTTRSTFLTIILPGILLAILAGLVPPYMTQLVGRATSTFIAFTIVQINPATTPDQLSAAKAGLLSSMRNTVIQFVIIAGVVLVATCGASTFWTISSERIARDLRKKMFEGIGKKDMAWFDMGMGKGTGRDEEEEEQTGADGVGGLVGRFSKDTDDVRMACSQNQGVIITNVTSCVACLILAFYHSYLLTLVILGTLPVITIFVAVTEKLALQYGILDREYTAQQSSLLDVYFSNLTTVKAFNAIPASLAAFTKMGQLQSSAYMSQHKFWAIRSGGTQFFIMATFVSGFWFGAYLVRVGKSSISDVNTTFWAALLSTTYLESTFPILVTIEKGKIAMAALLDLIKEEEPSTSTPPPSKDPMSPTKRLALKRRPRRNTTSSSSSSFHNHSRNQSGGSSFSPRANQQTFIPLSPIARSLRKIQPKRFTGELSLTDVTFSYPSRPTVPVLQNVTLYLAARETTFIVGSSGSGKSTVGSLLLGLYDPDVGRVEVDEQGIEWVDKSWLRGHVASVSQGQSALFDGTVHKNVAIGVVGQIRDDGTKRLATDVSREEVIQACRSAAVHDFIKDMPEGYDTWISGEKGASLSGGQRQRLALARAFIRDPTVLILDEATSALDATSRSLVADAVRRTRKNKTTIVITHDLTPISPSDFVYVLAAGTVVEQGYRNDLERNHGGPFWSMLHANNANLEELETVATPPPAAMSFPSTPPRTAGGFLAPPIDLSTPPRQGGSPTLSQRLSWSPSVHSNAEAHRPSFGDRRISSSSRVSIHGSPRPISISGSPRPVSNNLGGLLSHLPAPSESPQLQQTAFGFLARPSNFTHPATEWQETRRVSAALQDHFAKEAKNAKSSPRSKRNSAYVEYGFQAPSMTRSSSAPGLAELAGGRPISVAGSPRLNDLRRLHSHQQDRLGSAFVPRQLFTDEHGTIRPSLQNRQSSSWTTQERSKLAVFGPAGVTAADRRSVADGPLSVPAIVQEEMGKTTVVHFEEVSAPRRQIGLRRLIVLIYKTLPNKPLLWFGLFFACLCGACTPMFSSLLASLMANLGVPGSDASVLQKSLLILLVAFADGSGSFIKFYALERCAMRWTATLRLRMLNLVLRQDKSFFDKPENSTTSLTYLLIKDTEDARILVGTIAGQIFVIATMIIMSLTWAFVVGWQLTLVGLALGPVFFGVTRVEASIMAKHEGWNKELRENLSVQFHETVSNIRAIRAMSIEPSFIAKFDKSVEATYVGGRRAAPFQGLGVASATGMTYVSEAIMFYVGAVLIAQGDYTFAKMLQVFTLIIFSVTFAGQILGYLPMFTKSITAAIDLWRILELKTDTEESKGTITYPIDGTIAFNNVSFAYPSRPHVEVLKNVSFEIKRGECVGIVGASGSGKSTITNLLQRFYEPSSGDISLDGNSLRSTSVDYLREHLAIVSQHPALFDATISENIAYGLEGWTQAEVERAAKSAQVHDFIVGLPKGYQTFLGENASLISGGQAQRLQIARALIRHREILILDECTSALDPKNQAAVMETIGKAKQGKTTLIVTHKLAVMETCDRLLVINDGELAEQGTVAELRAAGGIFAKLARGGEWEAS